MLPVVFGHQHARVPPKRFPVVPSAVLARVSRLFGATPASGEILIGDGVLDVHLGHRRLVTALSNVANVEVVPGRTRRHTRRASTDAGPGPRAHHSDASITIRFHRPVPARSRWAIVTHPQVTVAVTMPDELARTLHDDCPLPCRPHRASPSRR